MKHDYSILPVSYTHLDVYKRQSHFQPWQQEREFQYEIPVTSDVTLALHGFIDRLDVYDDILCILDYKSSAKTLSETKVFAAMQLQLLTYSIVMAKLEQDVYKRQGQYSTFSSIDMESLNMVLFIHFNNANRCSIGTFQHRIKPVSYTHL